MNRNGQPLKAPPGKQEKAEMQRRVVKSEKTATMRGASVRERKMALQQEIDKLKKRLRHEEDIHRALERAFNRPLGALPRLPSYLPSNTLELLAEVAVLEEEVVRLEEQIVHFRQELYQEAVYTSSSRKSMDNCAEFRKPGWVLDPKPKQCKSLLQTMSNSAVTSDHRREKENQTRTNITKNKQQGQNLKPQMVRNPAKRPPIERRSADRHSDCHRPQLENSTRMDHQNSEEWNPNSQEEISSVDDNPNRISESILKCLMNIFLRMNSDKKRSNALSSSENIQCKEFKDPYRICSKFEKRDIGPYKQLSCIEAPLIDSNHTTTSIFLLQRLELLRKKLASVELKGLTHQEKLAFWINVYNACMMNSFIEYGIPESPEMVVALMQKATLNVGGHIVNAITMEHFILRLPYHSKHTLLKGLKYDGVAKCNSFGLELSEPLVTFALSCGSWSSPAVRVYTASQVENELETAKKEYLQAAIGISRTKKLIGIPKLLDWYLLDFAKDLESLLDWICLQLPSELGKEAMKCLDRKHDEPLLQPLQIMPYEFNFRYLLCT